ncbi:MAG: MinD/ParA family protein [Planctomycetaceae bacterium]
MHDQAQLLRGLMERRCDGPGAAQPTPCGLARSVAVTSGKGGVGKSNVALNLAIALARAGHSVCALDANLGLGNIDLLCGLNGYWNLSHVVSGARSISEVMLEGPAGIHVVPGASGLFDLADCSATTQREIIRQLSDLEESHDYLVVDTSTGIHRAVRRFVAAADMPLIVTTPEPTAIADAYATIKALSASGGVATPHVLVNQAESTEQAREIIARIQQTAQTFLQVSVAAAGSVPRDPAVAQAVLRRQPLQSWQPATPAGRAFEQLARRVINLTSRSADQGAFFARIGCGEERRAA